MTRWGRTRYNLSDERGSLARWASQTAGEIKSPANPPPISRQSLERSNLSSISGSAPQRLATFGRRALDGFLISAHLVHPHLIDPFRLLHRLIRHLGNCEHRIPRGRGDRVPSEDSWVAAPGSAMGFVEPGSAIGLVAGAPSSLLTITPKLPSRSRPPKAPKRPLELRRPSMKRLDIPTISAPPLRPL